VHDNNGKSAAALLSGSGQITLG